MSGWPFLGTLPRGKDRPEYDYYLNLLPEETVKHLFWECEWVSEMVQKVYRWMRGVELGRLDININMAYDDFMVGVWFKSKNSTTCDLVWKHYVKYYIYWCRQRVILPSYGFLKHELIGVGLTTRKIIWKENSTRLRNIQGERE